MTQEYIKELFEYKDGYLYWKIKRSSMVKDNEPAGHDNFGKRSGYRVISVDGKNKQAHRLIFLYHHGFMPAVIDHIDRNRLNNKIENLRQATPTQNQINRGISKNNKSGYKGVSFNKTKGKYAADTKHNGKHLSLGYFDTAEEASFVYNKKILELHKEFANG